MADCAGGPVQKRFLIGKQTDFDTTATPDKDVGIVTEVTDNNTQENIPTRGISDPRVVKNNKGTRKGGHTVNLEVQHGRFFEFIVGPASHAETTGDWTHTFSPEAEPSYFTAESSQSLSSDSGWQTDGNIIESAELSWGINQNLTLNVTTQSKVGDVVTSATTHVVDTGNVFIPSMMSIEINDTAVEKIQSASLTFTKQVEPVDGAEQQDPYCFNLLSYDTEVSMQVAFNDNTYNTHFKNQDITKIEYIGDNGVSLGSGQKRIYAEFDEIVVTEANTSSAVGSLTLLDLTAQVRLKTFTFVDDISSSEWF